MITLFAVPKPFHGGIAVIQRNAITSWTHLRPRCEIILFGDEVGTAELAGQLGVRHEPEVAGTDRGTPLVSDVFRRAQGLASFPLLCYLNADLIVLNGLPQAVKRVARRRERFLLVGQRWNLAVTAPLDFTTGWAGPLRARLAREGALQSPAGLDYFAFRGPVWEYIPPFAVGRTSWDNWLAFGARVNGVPVVDGTRCITCIHQDHGYEHAGAGAEEVWHGPEAQRNLALAGGGQCLYTVHDATWMMTGRRWLLPAVLARYLRRRWRHVRRRQRHVVALRVFLGRWAFLRRWALPG